MCTTVESITTTTTTSSSVDNYNCNIFGVPRPSPLDLGVAFLSPGYVLHISVTEVFGEVFPDRPVGSRLAAGS